jgi:hypothetical protein
MSSLACGMAGVERSFLLSGTVLVLKKPALPQARDASGMTSYWEE